MQATKSIDDYINKFYYEETQNINELIENIGDDSLHIMKDEDEDVGRLQDLAAEALIIKLVNLIITRAVESRASDIHIEPFADELRVRYRIDGGASI